MLDNALWARIKDHPLPLSDGMTLERRLLRLGRLGSRRFRVALHKRSHTAYLSRCGKCLLLNAVMQIACQSVTLFENC